MELIKKNLKTVKNKLLCELEDYVFESVVPLMSGGKDLTEEKQEELAKNLMKEILEAIKEKAPRFAIICYTDEDGKDLNEEDLKDIPLKIKILQECLPEIMDIMGDYVQGDKPEQGKPQKKPRQIRKKSRNS